MTQKWIQPKKEKCLKSEISKKMALETKIKTTFDMAITYSCGIMSRLSRTVVVLYRFGLLFSTLHLPPFKTQFYNRIMHTFEFDCPPFSLIDITMPMVALWSGHGQWKQYNLIYSGTIQAGHSHVNLTLGNLCHYKAI